MTKIWEHSQDDDTRTDGCIDWDNTDWQSDFDKSLGVPRWSMGLSLTPASIVLIEPDHLPDDYFPASGMFIVSERLKQLLQEFSVHAEFLLVRILVDGEEYRGQRFYHCDILDAVDCFDHSRGECTFHKGDGFTDHIDKIKKLAIDEEKASTYHLFCIAKGGEYIVCVSDTLANAIDTSGLTGMRFVEPDFWPAC